MLHSTRCFGSFIEKKTPELYSVICNLFTLYYLGLLLKRGSLSDVTSKLIKKHVNLNLKHNKKNLRNKYTL